MLLAGVLLLSQWGGAALWAGGWLWLTLTQLGVGGGGVPRRVCFDANMQQQHRAQQAGGHTGSAAAWGRAVGCAREGQAT